MTRYIVDYNGDELYPGDLVRFQFCRRRQNAELGMIISVYKVGQVIRLKDLHPQTYLDDAAAAIFWFGDNNRISLEFCDMLLNIT